jgi:transposase
MRFVRAPSDEELKELKRMTRQEVGRVAMRAHMVLLSARGYTVSEIVEIYNSSNVSVYKWLDRFDAQGPAGLYDQPRSGRPPKVDAEVKQAIEATLSKPPTSQDYNFTIWTTPLLRNHIERELGVALCCDTIRRTLRDLNFRWRRPRWAIQRKDPQAAQRMLTIAKTIWNAEPGTRFLVEDETKFTTLPPLRRMWMQKGHQLRIPTPEQNERFYSYATLDLEKGEWFDCFFEKANSDSTLSFLERLLKAYPKTPIVLIWDQAKYHVSLKVQEWIDQQKRLTVLLLPKYAPQLNPVEHIWRVVKHRIAANLTRAVDAIKAAYRAFFNEQCPQALLQSAGLAL